MSMTGDRLFTNISDTGKAFIIILLTDIFLGYVYCEFQRDLTLGQILVALQLFKECDILCRVGDNYINVPSTAGADLLASFYKLILLFRTLTGIILPWVGKLSLRWC